jgi:hypothetical protein
LELWLPAMAAKERMMAGTAAIEPAISGLQCRWQLKRHSRDIR